MLLSGDGLVFHLRSGFHLPCVIDCAQKKEKVTVKNGKGTALCARQTGASVPVESKQIWKRWAIAEQERKSENKPNRAGEVAQWVRVLAVSQ